MTKPLVIVDNCRPVSEPIGTAAAKAFHVAIDADRPLRIVSPDDQEGLDALDAAAGIVITGSPLMLGDPEAAWAPEIGRRIEAAARAGIPVLGVCFGHQLIAQHFGGRLDRWEELQEAARPVTFEAVGPFSGLGTVEMIHTHRDHVVDAGPVLRAVGSGGVGGIQALAHPELPIWTLQAHPESSAALVAYLASLGDALGLAKLPPESLDNPAGKRLLANFGQIVRTHGEQVTESAP